MIGCLHFEIETFEVGRGLWHARIRRRDRKPEGFSSEALDVGIAWPRPEAAVTDAPTVHRPDDRSPRSRLTRSLRPGSAKGFAC